jgi:hypothetical protein
VRVGVPIGPASQDPDARALPLVTDLGYADNVSLCSSTPKGLQSLIDCFCAYCTESGLMVNPTKCEVEVVCWTSRAWSGRRSWTLPSAGASRTALAVADKFKYLGLELHSSKDICAAAGHRLSQMVAAQSGVNRCLKELRIPFDPNVVTGLFDAITAAAGSYGCEVWSTRSLGSGSWRPACAVRVTRPPCTSTAWVCPSPLPAC